MPQQHLEKRIEWLLSLVRIKNLLIVAACQYLVRICLIPPVFPSFYDFVLDYKLHLLVLSSVFVTAAGYVINDYFDVKIDAINRPNKVVVGRRISRKSAMILAVSFNITGLLLALWVSKLIFLVKLLEEVLLFFYSNYLKRTALYGNVLVAFVIGLGISEVALFYDTAHWVVGVYAIYAFLITLIREIVKDMQDMQGDSRFGCATLPIVFGIRRTKYIIYATMLFFILMLLKLPQALGAVPIFIFWLFLLPLVYLFWLLRNADTTAHFTQISRVCKWIMLGGMATMVLV